jgi:hypothetical protein
VLVRIKASAVNPLDGTVRMGHFPTAKEPPLILGEEAAGIADRNRAGFKAGERVIVYGGGLGVFRDGTWAEAVAVPGSCLRRAAVRSAQRDEVAYATSTLQLLNVVPSDQSALRVAHEIHALIPVFASKSFDPLGDDGSQFLYRPCVEAAEEPSEVDAMGAVAQRTESTRQRGDDARCRKETMHQEDRSLMAVRR